MLWIGHRATLVAALALVGAACGVRSAPAPHRAERLPARISDREFWRMIVEFSEPGGYFRSDNFVSNETAFQTVIPALTERARPGGGVYFGVGPEQNFTYLVALRPKVAFIVDIRRQNMLQHLMYKALVELSADRAEFLSRLFARPRPAGVGAGSTAPELLRAYANEAPDSALFWRNLVAVRERLVRHHGFSLTSEDSASIEYVYRAFFGGGPELTYTFGRGWQSSPYRRMPTYAELMVETDGRGEHRSYLATEAGFRVLKELHANNLIIPLVGDFAGPKAIRAAGRWVKQHGATVGAFYTSNVEQYLFQQEDNWKKFYANVAALPVDTASMFIRAVMNRGGAWSQLPDPLASPATGPRLLTLLSPIEEFLAAFNDGRVQSYYDVIQISR